MFTRMSSKVKNIIDTRSIDTGLRKSIRNKHENLEFEEHLDNEGRAYADHLSTILPKDVSFKPEEKLYPQLRDGVVLAHALNVIKDGCFDLSRLVMPLDMEGRNGLFEATANLTKVLIAAKGLGIRTVNIGPEDILHENKGLILGLVWQIIKMNVTKSANILKRPELMNLLEKNEDVKEVALKRPEEMILRWVNFHLRRALEEDYIYKLKIISIKDEVSREQKKRSIENIECVFSSCFTTRSKGHTGSYEEGGDVSEDGIPLNCINFSQDVRDSKIYLLLMKQIAFSLVPDNEIV